jgi:hypothetical protein
MTSIQAEHGVGLAGSGFASRFGPLMAKRSIYKRDRRGRFASTGTTRIKRVGRKISRHRPRYVLGSLGKTVRVGRVGPGGEYAGVQSAHSSATANAAPSTTSGARVVHHRRQPCRGRRSHQRARLMCLA